MVNFFCPARLFPRLTFLCSAKVTNNRETPVFYSTRLFKCKLKADFSNFLQWTGAVEPTHFYSGSGSRHTECPVYSVRKQKHQCYATVLVSINSSILGNDIHEQFSLNWGKKYFSGIFSLVLYTVCTTNRYVKGLPPLPVRTPDFFLKR